MALKLPLPFSIFAPLLHPNQNQHRQPTEVRFSRWNNANAEKFNERRRAQQEIEDDIRRERRFDSANRLASIYDSAIDSSTKTDTSTHSLFKSVGTPSLPSKPSIPGKKSKYSKNPNPNYSPNTHPAFQRFEKPTTRAISAPSVNRDANVRIGEDGVSFVIDGAPFEFKYSYTETPKMKPIKLREPPYAPFGPTTMPRPWTGRAPLPPSKKKLKEFDSFQLPPPHKKGVKPVQKPGPFLPGSGPKYVKSREEILGEPLTEEEIQEMITSCRKNPRQLNIGRDGLTHNMLDNIHAHWKRRRVCKIKCKGVCTVDMDNVCQQLEERTGGKIVHRKGGVLYLFRGRNYNYKSRPRFPLMLWKPATPVYPKLIKRIPEGLTLEEATEMRDKGRNLIPICKLGKNGVYSDLVNNVREAFEECELVRINCQGMNGSDYKKIGAKLRDLVPCILISFEREHILMWRGRNWESSLPEQENDGVGDETSVAPPLDREERSALDTQTMAISVDETSHRALDASTSFLGSEAVSPVITEDSSSLKYVEPCPPSHAILSGQTSEAKSMSDVQNHGDDSAEALNNTSYSATMSEDSDYARDEPGTTVSVMSKNELTLDDTGFAEGLSVTVVESETKLLVTGMTNTQLEYTEAGARADEKLQVVSESSLDVSKPPTLTTHCTEGVLSLLKQAVEDGGAVVLDDLHLDDDIIYEKAVACAQSAPPGPVFRHRRRPRKVSLRKVEVQSSEKEETKNLESVEIEILSDKERSQKRGSKSRKRSDLEVLNNVVPQGSLRVDELAKLLA